MKRVGFKFEKMPKRLKGTAEFKHKALIADLRLKGRTTAEIVDILFEKGITNIKGGKVTALTINSCIHEAEDEWRECYYEDIAEHQKRLVRELQLVRKEAWDKGNLRLVVTTISEEAKILGVGLRNDSQKQEPGQKLIGSDEQQLIGNLLREAIVEAARRGVKLPTAEYTDADFRNITGEETGNLDTTSASIAGDTKPSG
jgi:hypothetical protein